MISSRTAAEKIMRNVARARRALTGPRLAARSATQALTFARRNLGEFICPSADGRMQPDVPFVVGQVEISWI
ncbi:MAG TPA: hypothetical protein VF086_07630 [Propionibacteriaceae bacterium]